MRTSGRLILGFLFQLAFPLATIAQPEANSQTRPISLQKQPSHEEGNIQQIDFHLNSISLLKSRYPELRGNGIIIGQKEHSPDPTDIDLLARLLPSALTSSQQTLHATTIASILVGTGYSAPLSEGIAPQSKLVSINFSRNLPETDDFYQSTGITILHHSYGTTIENFYGENAAAYDATAHRLPTVLPVFSAGNEGYSVSQNGKYAGLSAVANLTGNFKMSKNSLVVGAVDAHGGLLPSSSRGPAYDGRLKPELVAYGDEGTSGAAALVSGVSALLQQLYKKDTGTDMPSALLKATLINSAEDVGPVGIDYQSGYGSLQAFEAARTITEKKYATATLRNGDSVDFSIDVPNAQNLKVTLVWTDPAADKGISQALVNDLDMEMSDGQGTWQPWVLSTFPHLDSLNKAPKRGRDALNNVEQITLESPRATAHTIRVKGTSIASDQQTFYVVYQWSNKDEFLWISPNAQAPVLSDSTFLLHWKNTTSAKLGRLEFSVNEGQSWTLVNDQVQLETGSYAWKSPPALSKGQLRMMIQGKPYSSQPFVISPIPTVSLLYSCADSMKFTWQTTVSQPLQYRLHQFDSELPGWRRISTLPSTQGAVKGISPKDIFAIEPVSLDGIVGLKSELFNGITQGVSCYYKEVRAKLVNDEVAVVCELSTTEGVKSLSFEKQTRQGTKELAGQSVLGDELFYTAYDTSLQDGDNAYRVKIRLENGAIVYSDFTRLVIAREAAFIVYPNPVISEAMLHIQAKEYGQYTVRLVDYAGRLVGEYEFTNTQHEISVRSLPPGLYFYSILQADQALQRGKIMVR